MTELAKLRAAWEAERAELERRQLALAAVGASIAAGRYDEAQLLLDRDVRDTQRNRPLQFTVSIDPTAVVTATIVEPTVQHEERRSEKTTKKQSQRVDKPPGTKKKGTKCDAKMRGGGRPRSEKEGFEWHSSINKHTKYRCLKCDDIVGVRLVTKHECG